MSALTNPVPAAPPAPPAASPQPAPPGPSRGKFVLIAAAAVAGIAALWWWNQPAKTAAPVVTFHTAVVTSGPLEKTLRITGTTSARNYSQITVPVMRAPEAGSSLILLKLAPAGSVVQKGDLVVSLDAQAMQDHADDIADLVRQAEADVHNRAAEQAVDRENLQQTLRVAKATMEKARWDAQASGVKTDIERELLKLNVDEMTARYQQQQSDVVTRQASQQAEMRILKITAERHARHRDRHLVDVRRFSIHAAMPGLVVVQSIFRGGEMSQIQQGDQVYTGQPVAKIVDIRTMQVESQINQAQSGEIRLGQTVHIGLDAFPGRRFEGKVYSVGALAVGGWRPNYYIRNVPVRIAIEGADPQLIPDLSAFGDIVLERLPEAIQVPRAAVRHESGRTFVLVKNGTSFVERPVTLGVETATQAQITEGLKPGEEVRID